jgi:phenylalanyl-tRNA synthetase beta subunit
MEVVGQTLQHNRGFFTGKALVELINKSVPFSVTAREINHPLCILRRLGQIRLVEKGQGRKPRMYLKS